MVSEKISHDAELESVGERGLSRRSFLQGAIVAGAALASGGLVAGCTPSQDEPQGDAEVGEESENAGSSSAQVLQPTETRDVDVVVVGAGVAEWRPLFRRKSWV